MVSKNLIVFCRQFTRANQTRALSSRMQTPSCSCRFHK